MTAVDATRHTARAADLVALNRASAAVFAAPVALVPAPISATRRGAVSAATATPTVPRTTITPQVAPALERRQLWEAKYRDRLRLIDASIVIGASGIAAWVQIATIAQVDLRDAPWQYGRVFLLTVTIWLIVLALFQTRVSSIVGHGTVEYRRVAHATGLAFGILAIGFVILQSQGIRTQLLIALPLGIVGLLVGRWMSRQWLLKKRALGHYVSRALVVGNRHDVEYAIRTINANGTKGYTIAGIVLDGCEGEALEVDGRTYRSTGSLNTVASRASEIGADAVILTSTPENDRGFIRHLSWQLEGAASELVLSSPLVDVAGPRMSLQPIEGLPLIQVQIPTFEGGRHLLKRAFDITVSSIALFFIALVTPFVALAIVIDNPGPVFFRQRRVGRDGQEFSMLKFRSMRVNAEAELAALAAANEGSGPLFKLAKDPRVTRVGAILRKFSIDELPQFWNVFIGEMSVVGPRPPLPSETREYGSSTYRRLYIKPGITGLWQISGRSNLTWEESVSLDLRYVENWSVLGDLIIVWRTIGSVLKADGAY